MSKCFFMACGCSVIRGSSRLLMSHEIYHLETMETSFQRRRRLACRVSASHGFTNDIFSGLHPHEVGGAHTCELCDYSKLTQAIHKQTSGPKM